MIFSADRCKSNLCYTATGAAVKPAKPAQTMPSRASTTTTKMTTTTMVIMLLVFKSPPRSLPKDRALEKLLQQQYGDDHQDNDH